jgi:hypothetical protein
MTTQVGKPRLGHFICAMLTSKHAVYQQDQDKLFSSPAGVLETSCRRCGTPVHLEVNPKNKDQYFIVKAIQ